MSDLVPRIRGAAPHAVATADARDRARRAAIAAIDDAPRHATRRRTIRFAVAAAGLAAAAAVAAVAIALLAPGGDYAPRLLLPGDDAPTARPERSTARSRPGVTANVVLRPVAGLDMDAAYAGFVRVVRARAARRGHPVEVVRVDRDRALVTLEGTRESQEVVDVVTGSAVAAYDLDRVLVGTFASLPNALRRARELAPDAPARMAWLVRRGGGAVRGPAPRAADLPLATAPAGSEVLELPEGYAVLRRQYVRNARGDAERLQPAEYMLVRDTPSVTPLQVTGVADQRSDQGSPGRPITVTLRLSADGRAAWDRLLSDVSARAAALGRPQRIVVATNGDVWQTTTADAAGRLDTRPGSPALELGSFLSGTSGNGLRSPISMYLPDQGSIPAVVWVSDVYRVGPPLAVRGEIVRPLPAMVRSMVGSRTLGPDRGDPATVRRALLADGPDGPWAVWSYLTTAGSPRNVFTGPRRTDGFGFTCVPQGRITNCGGGPGFQVYAVPLAARSMRVLLPGGARDADAVGNGWAILLGPRARNREPGPTVRIEARDAAGRVIARLRERAAIP
ncbi:hypothetical protein [Miltoncostaea oceani]|uniref:hypothetical protein n=1 Tax=Miltoncostaea oceani TaxID=2843216 RepID=UPI001C3C7E91|nr:hypothetical protein [Miltoncostaea oceani]